MKLTFWVDETGRQLDRTELAALRVHARNLYENNTHIFEDEADALVALGLVAMPSLVTDSRVYLGGGVGAAA